MKDIQKKLLADMGKRGVTSERIKNTKNADNPYPVNGRYIWYLTKGVIKGKQTEAVMRCFFEDLENATNENN